MGSREFDPRRSARLSAESTLVKNQDREALGCPINGGGEPRGSRAHDCHVEDRVRIKLGRDAENDAGLSVGGSLQHRSIRTNHQRQLLGEHARALYYSAALCVVGGIEDRVGIAVATEKAFKSDEFGRARCADEHGPHATLLDQPDAAKDKRSHHDLAHLGRADHQCAHMGTVEWQRCAAFGTSAAGSQCRRPGELADLARELTGAEAGDRRLVIEAIAAHHVD